MFQRLKNEKPWAILKVSRRQYETKRPWVAANMPRQKFEELLTSLPDGFVDHCHRDVDAEKLVEAMFGKVE
ncbi:hypothetical protein [Desulfovibrio sp. TomC]|uniref:hypothetical protein n=1 Tax=Desulfovibrio sp. TomC TaxID=1562888 RepID=UPI0005BB4AAF|nr:hypothetical protein [Desulfovibrio sp. TomC]